MKQFVVPQVEVVRFGHADVLTSSPTCLEDVPCKPCPGCPPGSFDCQCYEFANE